MGFKPIAIVKNKISANFQAIGYFFQDGSLLFFNDAKHKPCTT